MKETREEIQTLRDKMRKDPRQNNDQNGARFRALARKYEGLISKLDDLTVKQMAALCQTASVIFMTVSGALIYRKVLDILKPTIGN